MLLMIDNYDSFTYNLVQYFNQLGQEVEVHRNDLISLDDIEKKSPEYIVISPGPCTPKEAGISVELIKKFKDNALYTGEFKNGLLNGLGSIVNGSLLYTSQSPRD